nr:gustatory receptor 49 [Papilio dardanus]
MIPSNKSNFLSKNYIHSYIEKILLPLTITQYIILSPKYYLRHNYISPNSVFINIILCCLTVIIFICFLYFSLMFLNTIRMYITDFLCFLFYFEHSVYAIGYIFNVLFLILQSQVNVNLIINIQMINNKIEINNRVARNYLIGNWIFCFLIFLFYCLNMYVQIFHVFTTYITIILSLFMIMPWDFNIIYAARIIFLLRKQTECWIMNFNNKLNSKNQHKNNILDNYHWQATLKAYLNIIDAYSTCEEITKIPIIYHVIQTFIQFITNIQTIIQVSETNNYYFQFKLGLNGMLVLCVMWTVKHSTLLTFLCWEIENLYMCLKNSQVVCLNTAYQDIPVSCRRICKQLRKEGKKRLEPMTANGLFNVNASLPLHVLSIIASYVVVLLQFNFL